MATRNLIGEASGRRREVLSVAASVLVVLGCLAWVWLQPGGEVGTLVGGSLITTASALAAGVSCMLAARRGGGTDRLGWWLMAAAMWSWTAANALWLWLALHGTTGPSVAHVLFVGVVPLALAGAAALGGLGRGGIRILLDGLIISGSLLLLSWATVLGPLVRAGAQDLLGTAASLALPIGDIAMASMVFILLARTERRRRSTLALVGGGMLALAVADIGDVYMVQAGAYSAGFLANVGWIIGFLLIGHGARRSRRGAAPQLSAGSPVWLLLPYVPLALALTTLIVLHAVRGVTEAFLLALAATLVVLVVARQWIALKDNVQLTRSLSATLEDLRRREEELKHLAFHDPLTGLANRALFHDRSERAVQQPATPLSPAVLYIDLDGFKQVNDRLGHAAGDALLVDVAARLRNCVRPTDTVARLGGDEFAVLLDGVDSVVHLHAVADRIVRLLGEDFTVNGEMVNIGASVGVARREADDLDVGDDLLRRADIAMYAAKLQGKRRYLNFEPHMRTAVAEAATAA